MSVRVTDHCVARIVERIGFQFDYDGIVEWVRKHADGCSLVGLESVRVPGGTVVIEDGVAVTFLEPGQRAFRKKPKRRKYRK